MPHIAESGTYENIGFAQLIIHFLKTHSKILYDAHYYLL